VTTNNKKTWRKTVRPIQKIKSIAIAALVGLVFGLTATPASAQSAYKC